MLLMLKKKYILYVIVTFVGIHVTFIKQFPQLSPWLKIIHSSVVCWSVLACQLKTELVSTRSKLTDLGRKALNLFQVDFGAFKRKS